MMHSENPLFSKTSLSYSGTGTMTTAGATNKALFLASLLLLFTSFSWSLQGNYTGLMFIGLFAGLILALVTSFKPEWSFWSAPAYAIAEGLFLGGFSSYVEAIYPGIAIQAVGITISILIAMLLAYKTGLVQVTERFKMGVAAATFGIFIFYMATFALSLFGFSSQALTGSGTLSLLISAGIVIIAALNLVIDFNSIEELEQQGAPKYMEWYSAFALLVTLIWLYIEVVKLLMKLRSQDE